MSSFCDLPVEILLDIVEYFAASPSILCALARVSQRLNPIASKLLYKDVSRRLQKHVMFWAVFNGRIEVVKKFLSLGAGVQQYWFEDNHYSHLSRAHIKIGATFAKDPLFSYHFNIPKLAEPESITAVKVDEYNRTSMRYLNRGENRTSSSSRANNWTLLHVAAWQGHTEMIELLMDQGADPSMSAHLAKDRRVPPSLRGRRFNGIKHHPLSPLYIAISRRQEQAARLLLERGAPVALDIHVRPVPEGSVRSQVQGLTALHAAVGHHTLGLVEYILDHGVQPDLEMGDWEGETALDYAYYFGHWRFFEQLLSRGAKINRSTVTDLRPSMLDHACHMGRFSDACRLIDYGANPTLAEDTSHGLRPLVHSCVYHEQQDKYHPISRVKISQANLGGEGLRFLGLLREKGMDMNIRNPFKHDETPLMPAIRLGNISVFDFLISSGVDVNCSDDRGSTALLEACKRWTSEDQTSFIKTLLDHGADTNCQDAKGVTPLHCICFTSTTNRDSSPVPMVEIAGLLVDFGANPAHRAYPSEERLSPLQLALTYCDMATAKMLHVRSGAPLYSPEEIWSLFKNAAKSSDTECLEFVLSLDQSNTIINSETSLIQLLKVSHDVTKAASLLIDKGAPCTGTSPAGNNTVYWAVRHRHGEGLVRQLVAGGADPNSIQRSSHGTTCPLALAINMRARGERLAYVRTLLDCGANRDLEVGILKTLDRGGKITTPLALGIHRGDDELAEMLVDLR